MMGMNILLPPLPQCFHFSVRLFICFLNDTQDFFFLSHIQHFATMDYIIHGIL